MGFRMTGAQEYLFITVAGSRNLSVSVKVSSGDSSPLEWCQDCGAQHVTDGGICTGMLAKGNYEALIPQANPHAAQNQM